MGNNVCPRRSGIGMRERRFCYGRPTTYRFLLCCSGGLTAACTFLMGAFPLPGALGIFPFAVWAPLWIGWESAAAWGLLALGAAQAACLGAGCVGLWRNSRRLTAAAVFAYGSEWLCAAALLFVSAAQNGITAFVLGGQAVLYLLSDGIFLLFLLLVVCGAGRP